MRGRRTTTVLAAVLIGLAGCSAPPAAGPSASSGGSTGPSAALSSPPPTATAPTAQSPLAPSPSPSPSQSPSAKATAGSRSSAPTTVTVTRTRQGTTITVGPPPSTPEPAAVEGDCPYLSADVVSDITGQHHGPTQVVDLQPYPVCQFYRSDGGWMASVRIVSAGSAAAAVAAVNQHVPIDGSQPAAQPAGWSGGSRSVGSKVADCTDCHSWYAVAKGRIAVVTEENETPSIKARSLAICAIAGLKLQAMPLPDYCTTDQ